MGAAEPRCADARRDFAGRARRDADAGRTRAHGRGRRHGARRATDGPREDEVRPSMRAHWSR